MKKTRAIDRRQWLKGCALTAGGAAVGLTASSWVHRIMAGARAPAPRDSTGVPALEEAAPAIALSLDALQAIATRARRAQRPPDLDVVHLGGIRRILGFVTQPGGDVQLLGERDDRVPPLHIDDLAVAVRSAYQVGGVYAGVPGVSIDPNPHAGDSWRVQVVSIFGLPPSRMAARAVAVDYQLKRMSASLVRVGDVPGLYDLRRPGDRLCDEAGTADRGGEVRHRYWFYPKPPRPPRFTAAEEGVLIVRPVDVQVLTEREFFDRAGRRSGAQAAEPDADRFARLVTDRLLATNVAPEFSALVSDFRVLELGKLLRFAEVSRARLDYLLDGHEIEAVAVASHVTGISREERGQATCAGSVTNRGSVTRPALSVTERIATYTYRSRGGVEANVEVRAADVAPETSGRFARLRREILSSRPSPDAVAWTIPGGTIAALRV